MAAVTTYVEAAFATLTQLTEWVHTSQTEGFAQPCCGHSLRLAVSGIWTGRPKRRREIRISLLQHIAERYLNASKHVNARCPTRFVHSSNLGMSGMVSYEAALWIVDI